jgi:hypothetical protein
MTGMMLSLRQAYRYPATIATSTATRLRMSRTSVSSPSKGMPSQKLVQLENCS